jgi:hypothetical protein
MKITEERLEELRNLPEVKRVKELRDKIQDRTASMDDLDEYYILTQRARELDPNVLVD